MQEGRSPLTVGLRSILLGSPSKGSEVGESILLARPAVLSVRRCSASRLPLWRGAADKRLNVCIVLENEPCRTAGEDTVGVQGRRRRGEERGHHLCALPNLVNGCEGSGGGNKRRFVRWIAFRRPLPLGLSRQLRVQSPLPICGRGEVGGYGYSGATTPATFSAARLIYWVLSWTGHVPQHSAALSPPPAAPARPPRDEASPFLRGETSNF